MALFISVNSYAQDSGLPSNGQAISGQRGSDAEDNSTLGAAQGEAAQDSHDIDLFIMDDVQVKEKVQRPEMGRTDIPREFIRNMPRGNNNITDMLSIMPSVQFDENYRSIESAGDIAPAEVSISGGRYYDNLFLIDGMSNSSQLDPASSGTGGDSIGGSGHSQKFFLNTWLVEDITVYDSDISAMYNGFSGGVVDVKIKRPSQTFGGNIAYRTTRSDWTSFFITDGDIRFKTPSGNTKNPEFSKNFYTAAINMPVTARSSSIFSYTRNESSISKAYFNGWRSEKRTSQNIMAKGIYNINGLTYVDATASYSPYEERLFKTDYLNSDYKQIGGGYFASANYIRETGGGGVLTLHTDFTFSENSQRAPKDIKEWIATSSKPWGLISNSDPADNGTINEEKGVSAEGGYGDLDKNEQKYSLSLNHKLDPVSFLGEHTFQYGVDYSNLRGRYHRLDTSYHYDNATQSYDVMCNGDYSTCVEGEQYLSGRKVYPESDVQAVINTYSAFGEDTWEMDKLQLRAGLRITNDDYMNNVDIAPRTQAQYDLFGNGNTVFSVGYNRYYVSALLANKLREGRAPWYLERRWTRHNVLQDWELTERLTLTAYNFAELKTPYTDEYVAAVNQALLGGYINVKYVERQGRNEFAQQSEMRPNGVQYTYLNNNGASEYRSAAVKWSRGWKNHNIILNGTWQESSTSNDNYDTYLGLDKVAEKVYLDGKLIDYKDLPKDSFSRPFVVNLAYVGKFLKHLTLSGNIKYKTSYKDIKSDRNVTIIHPNPVTGEIEQNTVSAYKTVHYSDSYTVDCAVSWAQPITGKQVLTVTMEVNNILNTKNRVGNDTSVNTYELGRQFWLGASYEF